MKSYQYILFDLDGTITDSGPGIVNSVKYALAAYSVKLNESELRSFVGPPLQDSFARYGIATIDQAIGRYRQYYTTKGMFENTVYPGMEEVLKQLTKQNKKLLVATSKPEVFAKQILRHFKLDHYFYLIAGASMDGSRIRKEQVIEYTLDRGGRIDAAQALMIGDREYDIMGAKQHRIDSLGVLYGYGNRAELEQAGATYIVPSVAELSDFVKNIG